MAELLDYAGKVDGELIRAQDWNGLIAAIDARLKAEAADYGDKIAKLQAEVTTDEGRLPPIEQRLTALESLATALTDRQRRVDVSSTRAFYAVGEGAEIVARVTDLKGAPLDLSNAAARPWIDFVTVWGTLQPAPGFTSVEGTGGRTTTVQVNAQGEAHVLLRADHAPHLSEAQHKDVAGVLATTVGTRTVAETILAASTPGSTDLAPVFGKVREAYQRKDAPVMRHYLDSAYLARPTRFYTPTAPVTALTWNDETATVLAFVKRDDNPASGDGTMAVGNVRVIFRNWIYPWITTHFMPIEQPVVLEYTNLFAANLGTDLEPATGAFLDVVHTRTRDQGILGAHREIAHAQAALANLAPANPPPHLQALRETVANGLTVHRTLLLGQAAAPLLPEDLAPARAVAGTSARSSNAAAGQAGLENRILAKVDAQHAAISTELLKPDGPIMKATQNVRDFHTRLDAVDKLLGQKASIDLVGQMVPARKG